MKRKIIKIDEEKCNGCGLCASGCPEGAIRVIKGKARLVGDLLCDGLGACIGTCPQGAISIEEREAQAYDEIKVMENIIRQGEDTVKAHLEHLRNHGQEEYFKEATDYLKAKGMEVKFKEDEMAPACGCPGSNIVDLRKEAKAQAGPSSAALNSELNNWPIQLKLINPQAAYLKNADLVIAADCVAFAYANFHSRFLKGKILINFCPKLDQAQDLYLEKLSDIFKRNKVKSVALVHMEVPCCFSLVKLVQEAIRQSGENIIIKEYTISLKGEII